MVSTDSGDAEASIPGMVSTEPENPSKLISERSFPPSWGLLERRPGMAAQRLRVRQIRNVLKLHYENGLPQREIARVCGIGNGTVAECLRRARKVGLVWPLPEELTDEALEQQLYRSGDASEVAKAQPDLASIHRELSRPGVTLQLLWVEYRDIHPDGYGYSRFCELYQRFRSKLHPTMRQVHPAGKKTFVDYSGKKSTIVDPTTGEIEDVELFVCYRTPKPGHCGTPEKRPLRVAVQPSIHPRPKEGDWS